MTAEVDFFATYAEAAYRASYLARIFDTPVSLRATEEVNAWLVELPANYSVVLDVEGRPPIGFMHTSDDELDYEANFETYEDDSEDLREELDEDRENWARSDDEGWFYP